MAAALLFLASVSDRGGALRACGRLATAADAAAQAWWKPAQLEMLNETKRLVTNTESELGAACTWDCFNRATMLAPLAADILQSGVKGDFLEAGVASGGISIFMAAMLHAAGVLGDRETGERVRKMWVADSFAGLPPPQARRTAPTPADEDRTIPDPDRPAKNGCRNTSTPLRPAARSASRCCTECTRATARRESGTVASSPLAPRGWARTSDRSCLASGSRTRG
tara:strand:- start:804 stop:1478 length:675 start_codon:yes stop_codon:yes gene_type:complete